MVGTVGTVGTYVRYGTYGTVGTYRRYCGTVYCKATYPGGPSPPSVYALPTLTTISYSDGSAILALGM